MPELLDLIIRVTLILGAAHLLTFALAKAPAWTRTLVLRLAIVACGAAALSWGAGMRLGLPILPEEEPVVVTAQFVPQTSLAPVSAVLGEEIQAPPPAFQPLSLIPIAWGLGALALLVSLGASWMRLKGLRSESKPVELPDDGKILNAASRQLVDLGRHRSLSTALTFGLISHTVLVPEGYRSWSLATRRAVLYHEAAHIRRFDCAWNSLALALRAVLWFHPLAWTLAWAHRRESEMAADEMAMAMGVPPLEYAEALLALAKTSVSGAVSPQGAITMSTHPLGRRIKAALRPARGFSSFGALALTAAAGLVFFATATTLAEPKKSSSKAGDDSLTSFAPLEAAEAKGSLWAPVLLDDDKKTEEQEVKDVKKVIAPVEETKVVIRIGSPSQADLKKTRDELKARRDALKAEAKKREKEMSPEKRKLQREIDALQREISQLERSSNRLGVIAPMVIEGADFPGLGKLQTEEMQVLRKEMAKAAEEMARAEKSLTKEQRAQMAKEMEALAKEMKEKGATLKMEVLKDLPLLKDKDGNLIFKFDGDFPGAAPHVFEFSGKAVPGMKMGKGKFIVDGKEIEIPAITIEGGAFDMKGFPGGDRVMFFDVDGKSVKGRTRAEGRRGSMAGGTVTIRDKGIYVEGRKVADLEEGKDVTVRVEKGVVTVNGKKVAEIKDKESTSVLQFRQRPARPARTLAPRSTSPREKAPSAPSASTTAPASGAGASSGGGASSTSPAIISA